MKRLTEVLQQEKIWSDKNHPDLMSQEDVNRYLREIRALFGQPANWDRDECWEGRRNE